MKCTHCDGSVIWAEGCYELPSVFKCISCGREVKQMEEKKTKRCCKCKKELPVEEFHKNKSSKDGLNSICKKCKSVYWHQKKDGTVIGTPLPTVLNKRKKPIRQILAGPPVCHLKTEIEKNPITRVTHDA